MSESLSKCSYALTCLMHFCQLMRISGGVMALRGLHPDNIAVFVHSYKKNHTGSQAEQHSLTYLVLIFAYPRCSSTRNIQSSSLTPYHMF